MKEKLLVLAKATPEISKKYEHLVCVAGITDKGEWRRIYPIPWKTFWKTSNKNFKKKFWIEYELESDEPSDHRPESRKIRFETIRPIREASFSEIEALLEERITSIEELEAKGPKEQSLGVVKPEIMDFVSISNKNYERLVEKSSQKDLFGKSAIKLDIPEQKYQYTFRDDETGRVHKCLCEDWELGELHRNCLKYLKAGRYRDKKEMFQKVKRRMLTDMKSKGHIYFIVGSHFRFPTYMIVGVVYPRKDDLKKSDARRRLRRP